MLDKKMYHDANEASLGVKLRRFQTWFDDYNNDVKKIKDEILYKSGHFLIHLALHLGLPQSI